MTCIAFQDFIKLADITTINTFLVPTTSTLESEKLNLLWKHAYEEGYENGWKAVLQNLDLERELGGMFDEGLARGMNLGCEEGYMVAKKGWDSGRIEGEGNPESRHHQCQLSKGQTSNDHHIHLSSNYPRNTHWHVTTPGAFWNPKICENGPYMHILVKYHSFFFTNTIYHCRRLSITSYSYGRPRNVPRDGDFHGKPAKVENFENSSISPWHCFTTPCSHHKHQLITHSIPHWTRGKLIFAHRFRITAIYRVRSI
jgi:hypothetical protein